MNTEEINNEYDNILSDNITVDSVYRVIDGVSHRDKTIVQKFIDKHTPFLRGVLKLKNSEYTVFSLTIVGAISTTNYWWGIQYAPIIRHRTRAVKTV